MPEPVTAERILTLVMAPSRAAPIVGDLLEEAPARGTLWFWFNIVRAALAFLWIQFTSNVANLANLALCGLAIVLALNLLYFGLGLPWLVRTLYPGGFQESALKLLLFLIAGAAARFLAPFAASFWIARQAAGYELAACLGLTFTANVGRMLYILVSNSYANAHAVVLESGFPYFLTASVFAAIVARRRACSEATNPQGGCR